MTVAHFSHNLLKMLCYILQGRYHHNQAGLNIFDRNLGWASCWESLLIRNSNRPNNILMHSMSF